MINECKTCVYKSKAAVLLSDDNVSNLSCNNLTVKFKKGDAIITQGTFSTNVVYIRSGFAKIHIMGPYHEQIIRLVKAPRYLGLPGEFGIFWFKVALHVVLRIGEGLHWLFEDSRG